VPSTGWTAPVVVMNARTLTSTQFFTPAVDFHDVMSDFVAQINVTFAVGDYWNVNVEGSLDGVNWWGFAQPTPGWSVANASAPAGTDAWPGLFILHPARYVRVWGDSGLGSPVVTVILAGRE